MNELDTLNYSSLKNNQIDKENNKKNERSNKLNKVLCNHCGRTSSNGIRCLGICVSDNDY